MNTPDTKSTRLLRTIAERTQQIGAMRNTLTALTAELADRPGAIDEVLSLELKLAAASKGLQAFQSALDIEREAEQTAQRERDRTAGLARANALKVQLDARLAAHVTLQGEADRFIAAIAKFEAEGKALATPTAQVAIAVRGPDIVFQFREAAEGTSPASVAAMATVIREIVIAFGGGDQKTGRELLEHFIDVRWSADRITLTEAGAMNAQRLEGLFA
jgi:hypothetical protein